MSIEAVLDFLLLTYDTVNKKIYDKNVYLCTPRSIYKLNNFCGAETKQLLQG